MSKKQSRWIALLLGGLIAMGPFLKVYAVGGSKTVATAEVIAGEAEVIAGETVEYFANSSGFAEAPSKEEADIPSEAVPSTELNSAVAEPDEITSSEVPETESVESAAEELSRFPALQKSTSVSESSAEQQVNVIRRNLAATTANPASDFQFDRVTGTILAYNYNGPTVVHIPAEINSVEVKHIGSKVFQNRSLTYVTIPSTVQSIGVEAFSGNLLTDVRIPDSVHTIGYAAFANNKIAALRLPKALKYFGLKAFSNNKLSAVSLPGTIQGLTDQSSQVNSSYTPDTETILRECFDPGVTTDTVLPIDNPLYIEVFRTGWKTTYISGDAIDIAARAVGGEGSYRYEFFALRSSGAEVVLQKYNTRNYVRWTPVTPDIYTVGVRVQDASGQKVQEAKSVIVDVEKLTVPVFRTGWKTEYKPGENVNLAARAEGGLGPYRYEFFVQTPSSDEQVTIREYSARNYFSYKPAEIGRYLVGVYAKDSRGKIFGCIKYFTVVAPDEVKAAVFRTGRKSEYTRGETVNLAARGEGGTAPYRYRFYVKRSSGQVVYLTSLTGRNYFNWKPFTADTYVAGVFISDQAGRWTITEKKVTVR